MRRDYWQLPPKIQARLGATTYGRQRALYEEGTLLLILHMPPKADDTKRQEILFLRKPDGTWECNGRDEGLPKLKRLLVDYQDLEAKLEKEYHEAQGSAQRLFDIIEQVAPLRRASHNMYETLQWAREHIKEDQDIIDARDRAYEIQRNFELLHMDAKAALDFRIAKNAEEDAETGRQAVRAQHRLNILAAIFFPLTALTALFGMNLQSGLERAGPLGFWVVLVGGMGMGYAFRNWVLTKR